MLARLWWKDARQFWPIWSVLVVAAAGCQWLLLKYGGDDARHGVLIPVALGWALLYGFAVSAAAFAGERENQTLAFLDMLPVSRRVLWSGKASFAVVSTVALAVTLAAMAWVYTDRWGGWVFTMVETGPFDPGVPSISELAVIVLAVVAVLLEVLGWGLFWSALSGNALIAAVLAMVSSAFGLVLIRGGRNPEAVDLVASAPWRLALALAAGGASAAVVSIGGRPGVSWDNVMGREVRVGPRAPGGRRKLREGRERARWGLRSPQVKALVWQTGRALWPVWWRLNMIGFGLPLLFLLTGAGADWGLVVLMNEVLVVVAAASVFGVENRAGTQRFLAHHGARPGVVWAVKLSVLAAYFAPVWVLLTAFTLVAQPPRQRSDLPVILVMLVTGVAVGQLSGMVIRRGITAALVAMIGVIAVGLPQVALVSWRMLSWQVPVLVPVVLLAVSWAWSGDWMLERPGLARWGRLALWLAVGFVTVFAAHALGRVWGVPDVGPGFDVAAFERAAAADPKDNAAELYGEAVRRSEVRNGPGEVLDIVRRASALPRCQFVPLEHVTKPDVERLKLHSNVYGLSLRVSNSARRRREAGDLAGAWDDLMVLFRMARHLTGPVPLQEAQLGLDSVERPALGDAMRWAADPRQTPERLRAALDAYRDLPPMPSVVETIRAESILVENTLNLPGSDLAALVGETFQGGLVNEYEKTAAALHAAAVTAPWEVARARRAFRLLYRGMGEMAGEGPGDRKYRDVFETGNRYIRVAGLTPSTYQGYLSRQLKQTAPLAYWLLPGGDTVVDSNDRNEVARRALVQILTLRRWQLTHAGKLPETLYELDLSGEVWGLPYDPYAPGRPFSYVRSKGQVLLPLGKFEAFQPDGSGVDRPRTTTGHRLLYSVGPDRRDDGASQSLDSGTGLGDIVFPLAEENPPAE